MQNVLKNKLCHRKMWCPGDTRDLLLCDNLEKSELNCFVMPVGHQSSAVLWCHGHTRVQLFCYAMGGQGHQSCTVLWCHGDARVQLFWDAMGTSELSCFEMAWGHQGCTVLWCHGDIRADPLLFNWYRQQHLSPPSIHMAGLSGRFEDIFSTLSGRPSTEVPIVWRFTNWG